MRCSALQLLVPKTCAAAHEIGAAARPLDVPRAAAHQGTLQRAPLMFRALQRVFTQAAARPSPQQRFSAKRRRLQRVFTQAAARLGPKTRAAARNHAGCSARLKP